jgi:hypothetical protein
VEIVVYRKRIKHNDLRTAKSHRQLGGGLGDQRRAT